jgi:hypothetical protein
MPRRIPKKFLIKFRNETTTTTTTISSAKINNIQMINRNKSEPIIQWTTLSKTTTLAPSKKNVIAPFYSKSLIVLIAVLIFLAVVGIIVFNRLKKKRLHIALVPSDSTTTNGSENPLFNLQETTLNQQVPDAGNSQKINVSKLKKSPSCTSHRLQSCDGLTTIPLN